MGLSVTLSNALSGMRIGQSALDVLSHNVANAGTPGYHRRSISVIDTLGIGMMFLGMAVQAGFSLVTLKLLFLLALVFFTWPVVTHALAQACLHAGVEPQLAEDRRKPAADVQGEGRASSN